MLKASFINILREPARIDATQVEELERIVKEYPFFESAHLLYTKGLHQHNALGYARQLRKTAIVANSRAVLYELLHPKEVLLKQTERPLVVEEKILAAPEEIQEKQSEKAQPEKEERPLAQKPVEILAEPEVKREEAQEQPLSLNPVTITDPEIKVVYITTVPAITEPALQPEEPVVVAERQETAAVGNMPVHEEIEIVQAIENVTQAPQEEPELKNETESGEERLNREIGREISRGVIQSYVEAEVIKTPELSKEPENKPLSFGDWLSRIKTESGTISRTEKKTDRTEKTETAQETSQNEAVPPKEEKQTEISRKPSDFEQKKSIIDKIIESDPGRIKLGSNKFFIPANEAKQSLLENEHLVTETLAKIYALQGNISKAIRAYEILSLKFPQKSVYFASLIEKLKK